MRFSIVVILISLCLGSSLLAQPFEPYASSATNVTSTSFQANWSSSSGADMYLLQVATNSSFTNGVFSPYGGSATLFTVTGRSPATTYYYRVQAISYTTGTSDWSNTVTVTTTAGAPPAPVAAAATNIMATSFSANWGSVSGATGYRLDVSTNSGFSSFVSGFNNLTITGTSHSVTGLSAVTTYYYRVRAVNATGTSSNSSTINLTTAPQAPVANAASNITSSSFTASWSSVSGAASYRLDVSTSSTFSSFLSGYNNRTVSGTNLSLTGISNQTTIYYRVRAVGSTGSISANSNVVLAFNYDQNYIRTITVNNPGYTSPSQFGNIGLVDTSYAFFDGLGRGIQTVNVKGSPSKKDIVQLIAYDQYGREAKKYLPYTDGNDGRFKPDALTAVGSTTYASGKQYPFYQTGGLLASDQYPYAETRFEASPLNRVIEQGAQGSAWQPDGTDSYSSTDRTIKKGYATNSANEVILWTYIPPDAIHPHGLVSPGQFSSLNYYPAERLYKNKTKDEEHNEVIEYVNLQGQTILKKVQVSATEWASTYYVYNDKGQLVVVLQPMAVKTLLGN